MWIRLVFFMLCVLIVGCVKNKSANCLTTSNQDSCAIIKTECEKRGWTYIYNDPLNTVYLSGFLCGCCE